MSLHDRITVHLDQLCEQIGTRFIGTAQNRWAGDYIATVFKEIGLEVKRQPFDCPKWSCETLFAASLDSTFDAIPNTFSPTCDVTAKGVAVGTMAELESADFAQKIAVLYGDLTTDANMMFANAVYLPEKHQRIGRLLQHKRPLAVACINGALGYCQPIISDWRFGIPGVTISAESGLQLMRNLDAPIIIKLETSMSQGESANIIGSTVANNQPRILLSAHYDTKYDTVGAYDNGSGIVTLLALAEMLMTQSPALDLEFVAFSGEEYGLGDDTYLASYGLNPIPFMSEAPHQASGLDAVTVAINMDGIGSPIATNNVATFEVSTAIEETVTKLVASRPSMKKTAPWPASNHYSFYSHKVPTVALSSVGFKNLIDHPNDTTDWVSPSKLVEVGEFVIALVQEVGEVGE